MPNNTHITDAELAEVKRLVAAAGLPDTISIRSATIRVHPLGPDLCSSDEHEASLAALHNAFGPILARLEAAEMNLAIQTTSASMRGGSLLGAYKQIEELQKRLEAAERERDELRGELAYIKQQLEWVEENGDTYQKSALMDFIRRTIHGISHTAAMKEALAAHDAQQRRGGAIEAFDEMRRQAEEVGQQSGLAEKMCKIFADECIEQAAKRLREGGE